MRRVWLDEEDQSIVIRGWKITDAATIPEITATKAIPGQAPARMAPFLLEYAVTAEPLAYGLLRSAGRSAAHM